MFTSTTKCHTTISSDLFCPKNRFIIPPTNGRTQFRNIDTPRNHNTMSFAMPQNVPSFNDPRRAQEDAAWSSSGRSRFHRDDSNSNGFGLPTGGSSRELPMYKDKPYNYPPGRRRGHKRLWLGLGVFFGIVWLYYSGWIGGRQSAKERESAGKGLWGTFSSTSKKGPVNWTARREQVKKAMEISWSGYEKYAWGVYCGSRSGEMAY